MVSFGPLSNQDIVDLLFKSENTANTEEVENLSIPVACLDLKQPKTLKLSTSSTDLSLQFQLVEVDAGLVSVTGFSDSEGLNLVKITDLYVAVRKTLVTLKEHSTGMVHDAVETMEQIRHSVAELASMTLTVSVLVLEEILFKLDTLILQITMKCDDIIEISALTSIRLMCNLRLALYHLQQLIQSSLQTAQPLVHSVVRPMRPVLTPFLSMTRFTVGMPIRLVFGRQSRLYELCDSAVNVIEELCTDKNHT